MKVNLYSGPPHPVKVWYRPLDHSLLSAKTITHSSIILDHRILMLRLEEEAPCRQYSRNIIILHQIFVQSIHDRAGFDPA
jgi:hypothetical protein